MKVSAHWPFVAIAIVLSGKSAAASGEASLKVREYRRGLCREDAMGGRIVQKLAADLYEFEPWDDFVLLDPLRDGDGAVLYDPGAQEIPHGGMIKGRVVGKHALLRTMRRHFSTPGLFVICVLRRFETTKATLRNGFTDEARVWTEDSHGATEPGMYGISGGEILMVQPPSHAATPQDIPDDGPPGEAVRAYYSAHGWQFEPLPALTEEERTLVSEAAAELRDDCPRQWDAAQEGGLALMIDGLLARRGKQPTTAKERKQLLATLRDHDSFIRHCENQPRATMDRCRIQVTNSQSHLTPERRYRSVADCFQSNRFDSYALWHCATRSKEGSEVQSLCFAAATARARDRSASR